MYRSADMQDCEAVYQMICDMESKMLPYDRFQEIFQRQLEDGRYECIICEENGETIGVLNMRFEEQLHHSETIAEILEFVIAPGYRKKGFGKDMLAWASQRAKEKGCSQIEVACNQLRSDTHRFYLREGMKNYHFKFSKRLNGTDPSENVLGR